MATHRQLPFLIALVLWLGWALASPAAAATKTELRKSGNGIQVVVSGLKTAKAVTVTFGGMKLKLKKKGALWVSAVLTGRKAKTAGAAAAGKIGVQAVKRDGKKQNAKVTMTAKPEVITAANFGGARPAPVTGGAAIAAFQARLANRILRWVDNPASYNSSETWGLAANGQAVTYYFSPATVGTSIDQKFYKSWSVTDAIENPASLPTVAIVGQINLGGDLYNIAFYYAPVATNNPRIAWEGAYAKVGGGEYPFYTYPFVSESQVGP